MTGSERKAGGESRPRLVWAIVLGVVGTATLLGLMSWQLQRLAWKEGLIAQLEDRLAAEPTPPPAVFDTARDEFHPVRVTGRFTGAPGAHGFTDVARLTTIRPWGAGYRVIQPFETEDGRLFLVDRGFVPVAEKNEGGAAARPTPWREGPITLEAVIRFPDDDDFFADDAAGPTDNVWLTRETARLSPLWGAEDVLLVASTRTADGEWPVPRPVTVDLPNDHLEYAITWGSLALVWAGMSILLVRRERRAIAAEKGQG